MKKLISSSSLALGIVLASSNSVVAQGHLAQGQVAQEQLAQDHGAQDHGAQDQGAKELLTEPSSSEYPADSFYDPTQMKQARHHVKEHHGNSLVGFALADRLEFQTNEGNPLALVDAHAWLGTDEHKLWLEVEAEYLLDEDTFEEVELQALYAHPITTFFDANLGLRYDPRPTPERSYLTFGVHGLAPYLFEVDALGFVSHKGDVSFRTEAEYELLLTQRLILQPRLELNFAVQDVEELGIGAGLSDLELGARLRYEIIREFAPYIGVSWKKLVATTADYAQAEGEETSSVSLVVGIRLWY